MRTAFKAAMSGVTALALLATPALAQTCPPGYYYASDGRCYYGPPPTPVAPPVDTGEPNANGLIIGLGLAAIVGGILAANAGHDRGHAVEHRGRGGNDHRGRGRR